MLLREGQRPQELNLPETKIKGQVERIIEDASDKLDAEQTAQREQSRKSERQEGSRS